MGSLQAFHTAVGVVFFVVLGTVQTGWALQCYDCSLSTPKTDNTFIQTILNAVTSLNNDHCRLLKDSDTTEVNLRNCPAPLDGQVSRCLVANGVITTTVLGTKLDIHTLKRSCWNVDKDSSEADGACIIDDGADGVVQSALSQLFTFIDAADIKFKGKTCFFDHNTVSSGSETLAMSRANCFLILLTYLTWYIAGSIQS